MNWDDIKILLAVGRTGGLSRAAKLLGTSISTVHRRAAELEKSLNVDLFARGSEGYTLTETGQRYFALAQQAEEHLVAMERYDAFGQQTKFRVALPELVGQQLVIPKLLEFQAKHTNLSLEISTSVAPVEFHRRQADLILRLVRPDSGRYLVRKVSRIEYALYCHPDYLEQYGHISCIDDLSKHRIIGWDRSLQHTFLSQWLDKLSGGAENCLSFDCLRGQMIAAQQGCGIAALPVFAVEGTSLVRILNEECLLQGAWIMRHNDTKNSWYSTAISDVIESALLNYS